MTTKLLGKRETLSAIANMVVGSGVGVVLYCLTGHALFLAITVLAAGIGSCIGACGHGGAVNEREDDL
jgi:hypothetical protein